MDKKEILKKCEKLMKMHNDGLLGGEIMPEDANPQLAGESLENYLYFTLPMALNYQRNSYILWESALKTYNDKETNFVFNPKVCLEKSFEEVQYALTKYKVALQKQKQTEIWLNLCKTFVELFDGDIRKIFDEMDNDVDKIRNYIQIENKKKFPYLSGTKICNYWLYVIYQYTNRRYKNIENLTVAPDTHVIKATHRLGLINDKELESSDVQLIVIDKWNELFKGTKYNPIDIHTALWLWSRNGFCDIEDEVNFFKILETCKYVVDNSKHVKLNKEAITNLVNNMALEKPKHWLITTNPYGILDYDIKDLIHFLFVFGSIDCSFWGEPKWQIEADGKIIDGAFALIYVFTKIKDKEKHLDFTKISYDKFKKYFTGNVLIPLIKERYEVVREVSEIINDKFNGNIYDAIKEITNDTDLFNFIITNFPSFKDERTYNNKTIYFYKLGQLLTSDILHIRELKENIDVDYSHLVGCADYKIPQVLRGLNILEYSEELSDLVDKKCELLENSIYEVEIRASMIVAINMIKEKLNNEIIAIDINDIIWGLGQDKSRKLKPYHLTRTLNY